MIDPVTGTVVIAGGLYALYLLWQESSADEFPPPSPIDIVRVNYHPTEPDCRMIEACQRLCCEEFDCTLEELPQAICKKMRGMSLDQRKAFMETLTRKACATMNISVKTIKYDETNPNDYGCYNAKDDSVTFSVISIGDLSSDITLIESIKTVFHELKHAVQYKALKAGGNVWGYPDDVLLAWADNFYNYISPRIDMEAYVRQAVELDAFGFESSVIPYEYV